MIAAMGKKPITETNRERGRRIAHVRELLGLGQEELSQQMGLSRGAVGNWELGQGIHIDNLEKLASKAGVSLHWLRYGEGKRPESVRERTVADPHLGTELQTANEDLAAGDYRPTPEFLGERDLPVFAAVEGGPGEMVISTEPIDMVPRPWFLARVRDAYAVLVTGESMLPVYDPGDMVLVNPKLPPMKGKDAIFVAGEAQGEFRASIKRYIGSTEAHWMARQFNPPEGQKADLKLDRREWQRALRVVGRYTG